MCPYIIYTAGGSNNAVLVKTSQPFVTGRDRIGEIGLFEMEKKNI